jgi:N-sulfoglucosamine sulfohydrolase
VFNTKPMKKRIIQLKYLLFVIFGFLISACTSRGDKNASKGKPDKGERPNILLIVSEDNGQHLSCYGDPVIKTPNLDKIASEGVLFKNAYVTQSVSSPSRSSIFSGLYPHQSGHLGLATHGYHYVGKVQNIYQILKDAGYRTGMIGKLHVNPESDFPIDFHPIKENNFAKKGLERYSKYADSFMNESDDPFFLMVNYPDAHFPFQDAVENRPAKTVTPDEVIVFPYIGLDNERIRRQTANIYNCMLRLDECVGELMKKLSDSGKEENTLVIYLGDHGCQMARAKGWVYEASNLVPFIVKWHGKTKEGVTSNALISTIDIVPTICEVLGLEIPERVTGKSLLPLLEQPDLHFRDHLFVERNSDAKQFYFPQRAIRDKRYKLIYSLLNDREDTGSVLYTSPEPHPAYIGTPTLEELKSASNNIKKVYQTWIKPPSLQLYDLQNDPWEFNDLADNPDFDDIKKELFERLKKWQEDTDDPLRFPEKLKALTIEHDTIVTSANRKNWRYPDYLYGK